MVTGAVIACTMGSAPSTLDATSQKTLIIGGKPAATIKDMAAFTNIAPCGMCSSMQNPEVSAATSAAMGVLQPQPCKPNITETWHQTQGTVITEGGPCLMSDSKLSCSYFGTITVSNPGQKTVLM